MKINLSRAATLMDKYGWGKGIDIYFRLKRGRLSGMKLPGIAYPFSLRSGTTDRAVFEQVFVKGEYDIEVPFTPGTVIDAGANIGLFSIYLKNKFPGARIICIEPGKENCELLEKNLSAYQDVDFIRAGLWHSDSRLDIADRFNAGQSALVTEESQSGGDTRGIAMDTLMNTWQLEKIDILKIDIEGSEQAVFSKNYEQWLPKVKMIIIELHDWLSPGCSKPFFEAIQKTFSSYSYAVCGENTIIINEDPS